MPELGDVSISPGDAGRRTPRRVRACHVLTGLDFSDAEQLVLDLAARSDHNVLELHVLCSSSGALPLQLERRGIEYTIAPGLGQTMEPVQGEFDYQRLSRFFAEHCFDIVHTFSFASAAWIHIAARDAGTPVVLHHYVHDGAGESHFESHGSKLESPHPSFGDDCDRVIVQSRDARDMLVRSNRCPAGNCLVIESGITRREPSLIEQHAMRTALRSKWKISDTQRLIAVVSPPENVETDRNVTAIAARLTSIRPTADWTIVAAADHARAVQLKSTMAKMGIADRVRVVDSYDQWRAVYCAADVALAPPPCRGVDCAFTEILRAGLPLVAGETAENWEILGDGAGLLCDPESPGEFASALALLLEDSGLRYRYAEAAYRRALWLGETGASCPKIFQVYDELLRANGRAMSIAEASDRRRGDDLATRREPPACADTRLRILVRPDRLTPADDSPTFAALWSRRRR